MLHNSNNNITYKNHPKWHNFNLNIKFIYLEQQTQQLCNSRCSSSAREREATEREREEIGVSEDSERKGRVWAERETGEEDKGEIERLREERESITGEEERERDQERRGRLEDRSPITCGRQSQADGWLPELRESRKKLRLSLRTFGYFGIVGAFWVLRELVGLICLSRSNPLAYFGIELGWFFEHDISAKKSEIGRDFAKKWEELKMHLMTEYRCISWENPKFCSKSWKYRWHLKSRIVVY